MKSISDVVSGAGLYVYAEVALVIFFAVFLALLARVLLSHRNGFEHAARLPLDDESTSTSSSRARDS